jgi:hypothetical protein
VHSSRFRLYGNDSKNVRWRNLVFALFLGSLLVPERQTLSDCKNMYSRYGVDKLGNRGRYSDETDTISESDARVHVNYFRTVSINPPDDIQPREQKLLMTAEIQRIPGVSLDVVRRGRSVINPSVIRHDGVSYFAAREHMKLGSKGNCWWSNIVTGILSNDGGRSATPTVANSTYLSTNLSLPPTIARCFFRQKGHYISGPADPRLFVFRRELWIAYSYYSFQFPEQSRFRTSLCSKMESYSAAIWVQNLFDGTGPVELVLPSPKLDVEKNWVFFSHNKRYRNSVLFAITSVEPHVVLDVSPVTGECREVSRTSYPRLFGHIHPKVRIHLGAVPSRIVLADHLHEIPSQHLILRTYSSVQLGMFHTKDENYNYDHYFYLFNDKHPFDVVCVSAHPSNPPRKSGVSYETNVELHTATMSTRVNVWYGVDDETGAMSSHELRSVLNGMTCRSLKAEASSSMLTSRTFSPGQRNVEINPRVREIRFSSLVRSSSGFFNPSIVSLPRDSLYPYVVVARAQPVKTEFRGSIYDKLWKVTKSQLVACILDAALTCVGKVQYLDVSIPFESIEERLASRADDDPSFNYDAFVGAEDGRLVWSSLTRQVFLTYGMNSEYQNSSSRNVWVVDLATLYPFLTSVIKGESWSVADGHSMFTNPTELVHANSNRIEKNWIMFQHDSEFFVSYSIQPHVVLQPLSTGAMIPVALSRSDALFSEIDVDKYSINQGSGIIRVKMCMSGSCPDNIEERYICIFHTRDKRDLNFDNYLAVIEVFTPFRVVHVISLKNHDQFWTKAVASTKFVYALSLDFVRDVSGPSIGNTNVATLDSVAIVGIGVDDEASFMFTTTIFSLLGSYMDGKSISC